MWHCHTFGKEQTYQGELNRHFGGQISNTWEVVFIPNLGGSGEVGTVSQVLPGFEFGNLSCFQMLEYLVCTHETVQEVGCSKINPAKIGRGT